MLEQVKHTYNGILKNDFSKFIIIEYMKEHFKSYVQKEQNNVALDYEIEFLLFGKEKDKENLNAILLKLLTFRMVSNYYIISNSLECKQKVSELATEVSTILQIPLLEVELEHFFLALWSLEESIVDVRALFENKSVPLVKKEDSIVIRFEELLVFNKGVVRNKIENWENYTKKGEKVIGYDDYLMFFLMQVKDEELIYRCLNIIQENIKVQYNVPFCIEQGCYALETEVKYSLSKKFSYFLFPGFNEKINRNLHANYSY